MTLATVRPVIAVAFVLVLATACNRSEPEPATSPSVSAPAATTEEERRDAAITMAVRAKYYTDEMIRGRDVDVSARDGIVTLRGTLPSEAARHQAVALARSVEGVTSVDDRLEVREAAAARNEADEPESSPIGTTGTAAEARPPWWITTKIQAQYFADADVRPWNVDVTTSSGGVVTLEGTVNSEVAKNEAVRIARETEGVTRVEDRLRVGADAPRGDTDRDARGTAGIAQPDAWLTAKVQAKYFVDDEVKMRNIDVDTRDGVVTLKGTVASASERRQAVAVARNTDGVRDVRDLLEVDEAVADAEYRDRHRRMAAEPARPGVQPGPSANRNIDRPDPWITMKIQAKYFLDADVKGHRIDVETKDGVVTLRGRVETAQQKQEAEQIARETSGVERVNSQLTVGAAGP